MRAFRRGRDDPARDRHDLVVPSPSAPPPDSCPVEPVKSSGQSVTGAFEGWYQNPDGSFTLLVGYFNRNTVQTFDIPVGPNNRIEPGMPDQGQPTHFLPRRQWGVFTIKVPKDFGKNKLTWTIVANGQTTTIPLHLDPLWIVAPFKDVGINNTPPTVKFSADGAALQGPPSGFSATLTTPVSKPLPLTVWASDDGVRAPRGRAAARPSRHGVLEQVPRSWRRDLRQRSPHGRREDRDRHGRRDLLCAG